MTDTESFALLVLVVAAVGLVAVQSNRVAERLALPAPALFLVGAALAANFIPGVHAPSQESVERVVTVALLLILFDGGMSIGRASFRSALGPIASLGVAGTFLTAGAGAVLARYGFGLSWYPALLVATAVAPTDPAVVFSVLGRREVTGRSSLILEGESGANDPVGIALLASLLAAGTLSWAAFGQVAGQFALQMAVGAAVGVLGGRLLLLFVQRVPLPSEGLYPLRTLACAFLLYGAATLAHGSGFLAVFLSGMALGDERAPYKREMQRFHGALASLGEIVAFVVLGLTVDVSEVVRTDVWVPGVVLGVLLALVIRPLLVGACLLPARLGRNERLFVLLGGLKGAVPILLGSFLLASHVPGARRLFGIVVVVVVFSVVAQGTLVPYLGRWLRLPMRTVQLEPWSLGVRLQEEPTAVRRFVIAPGSRADGCTIEGLNSLPSDAWVALVVRAGRILPANGGTRLQAGDDVLVVGETEPDAQLSAAFEPEEP